MSRSSVTIKLQANAHDMIELDVDTAQRLLADLIAIFPGYALVQMRERLLPAMQGEPADWLGWDSVQNVEL